MTHNDVSVKPKVWVLGNGQLGAMLAHAGQPLAIEVCPVDVMNPVGKAVPLAAHDIITAEREQWPDSSLSRQLSGHAHFVNQGVFSRLADRVTQKSLLDQLAVATAPWQMVSDQTSAPELHQQFGPRVLLKRRTGGYDGKGQHWLIQDQDSQIPASWHGNAIAEQAIGFDEEVSLVGCRDQDGHCSFYPLTLNLHQNGILTASIAPLERLQAFQAIAESMLSTIMDELEYIGVMAMECFRVGEQLLVNELAPRVHNSGHWTQAACSVSQFELHLRALCALPIPALQSNFKCVMVNLIGVDHDPRWLSLANGELFWYGKEVRAGRKVGHLNLSTQEPLVLKQSIDSLKSWLPPFYKDTLQWVLAEIN